MIDKEIKHMGEIIKESHLHKGTSFVEIYQNCNIFNDGAFSDLTNRDTKQNTQLVLEHDKPMVFGQDKNLGIILDGSKFKSVEIGANYTLDDILVHNIYDKNLAVLISEMTYDKTLPVPIGIFYKNDKPTYEEMMQNQINDAIKYGTKKLDSLDSKKIDSEILLCKILKMLGRKLSYILNMA